MTGSEARHDSWSVGDSYEAYMGRWSRRIATEFLDWVDPRPGQDWLDVGCGTGALSATILQRCAPTSVLGVEQSAGFAETARSQVVDARVAFEVGDAQALPVADASRDVAASALALNFVLDMAEALAEMRRAVRPGGTVAFYVWDYPGGGVRFMSAFWQAAAALDPKAADLSEDRRFPFCTPEALAEQAEAAGLAAVESTALETPTVFADFDDYWRPFTLGAGPAPGYCASLAPDDRDRLRRKLEADLPRQSDGSIALTARAWGVKGRAR